MCFIVGLLSKYFGELGSLDFFTWAKSLLVIPTAELLLCPSLYRHYLLQDMDSSIASMYCQTDRASIPSHSTYGNQEPPTRQSFLAPCPCILLHN